MRYRMVICVLLVVVVGAALACSLFKPSETQNGPTEASNGSRQSGAVSMAPIPYWGVTSIEERISASAAVIKARLTNTTTEVVTTTFEGLNEDYYVALKFHLSVSEYLSGSGSNNIDALWVSMERLDTRREAQDAAPRIAAQRNTLWDNREALLFLEDNNELFGPLVEGANNYFLAHASDPTREDFYSLISRYDRRWLPAASATPATPPSDGQEFLLEAESAGSAPATITLGELKTRVTAVNTELNGGDGSAEYKDCVRLKYKLIRRDDWRESTEGKRSLTPKPPDTFASGQAAGTELFKYREGFVHDNKKSKFWLDGSDSALFTTKEGPQRARDSNRDGQPDGFLFDQYVVIARPLPQGSYTFNTNLVLWTLLACGHTYTYKVTANVTAPEGTLHELFFDPVTVGSTVAADGANGVLEPATLTDANGGSATISSISYESGTAEVEVTPDDALAGHIVDIIELDGAVSLSLVVDEATLDAANGTLSWAVAEQPWHDGDLLMLRIREAR